MGTKPLVEPPRRWQARTMRSLTFQHLRDTPNVGDLACSPGEYFDFAGAPRRFQHIGSEVPAGETVIYGGGQIFGKVVQAAICNATRAHRRIVWGAGIDAKQVTRLEFDILSGSCALISSRVPDVPGCDYVPCASAMSPLLDAPPPPPHHDVVLFAHARKSDGLARPVGIPTRTNHGGTLAQTIEFLASGATVVTNSFHGTYWTMLLGRRVLCLPFSDKFTGFADRPATADPAHWPAELHRARAHPGALDHARAANRAFYEKVMTCLQASDP